MSRRRIDEDSTSATFSFSGSDSTVDGVSSGVDYFEYKLDGGNYETASSPVHLTGLAQGPHTFSVEAVDNAGNVSSAASYSWIVDTTLPVVTIGEPFISGDSITYAVSVTDPIFESFLAECDRFQP